MNKTISLQAYAPSIGSEDLARNILQEVKDSLFENDSVIIDFSHIQTMGTNCAKLIFGELYNSFGATDFFNKVRISNATQNIQRTIRLGIEFSLPEG